MLSGVTLTPSLEVGLPCWCGLVMSGSSPCGSQVVRAGGTHHLIEADILISRATTSSPLVDRHRLALCALACALLLSLVLVSRASAMSTFSSDLGQTDPCARAGIGGKDGGTAIKHDIGGTKSEKPVNVMLQCSPLLTMHAGILSADNLIREHFGGPKFVNPSIPRPYFMGNRPGNFSSDGRWLETKGLPYIHGKIAEKITAPGLPGQQSDQGGLFAAAGGLTGALATSAVVCAVGGIPSLGIACGAAAAILGGAVITRSPGRPAR